MDAKGQEQHETQQIESIPKVLAHPNPSSFLNKTIHTAGHDLRSPLFVVRSYAQLLQKTDDEKMALRGYKAIEKATVIMEETIDGLVQLMDIYTVPKTNKEVVDFTKILNEVKYLLYNEIEALKPTILTEISTNEVTFVRPYLVTILKELVSNSIKHNPNQSDLQIIIACKIKDGKTMLSVADNGRGLPNDIEENLLLQPFYKVGEDTDQIGIGLAKVDAIAKISGSQVTFRNTEDGCQINFEINQSTEA